MAATKVSGSRKYSSVIIMRVVSGPQQ